MSDKIIDFEEAKLKYEVAKVIKKFNKIYNDIDIYYYYLPDMFILGFVKTIYKKEVAITYEELKNINIDIIVKCHINRFIDQVYKKREQEMEDN